jgi:hypothetical protein
VRRFSGSVLQSLERIIFVTLEETSVTGNVNLNIDTDPDGDVLSLPFKQIRLMEE